MKPLEEIKARAEAATPGPWYYDIGNCEIESHCKSGEVKYRAAICQHGDREWNDRGPFDDFEFIAHARTDIPRLIAVIEKLIEQRDGLLEEWYVENHGENSDAYKSNLPVDVGIYNAELEKILTQPSEERE